jgi:phosphatidylglycerol---prolipoprotein diacylglyceryl transferase
MITVTAVLASIPSPSTGVFHLGPFTLHMYGVMLLLAIAACIWLTGVRWVRWGGDWDLVYRTALWGVIFGIVGARLYHDVSSWNQDQAIHDHWWGVFAVWQGGLGIWGAIPFGVAAGGWVVRRSGNSIRLMMDAAAPGLLLAQGIGRWGNYWNQELYGKPTSLPWGLKIDSAHQSGILARYQHSPFGTYTPTFLYEFTWNVLGVLVLLWIDRRFTLRRPSLFALYVAWYTTFRTYEETLRIDPSNHLAGMRINFWVSLGVWIVSVAFFVWWQFLRTPSRTREPKEKPRPLPTGPRMTVPKGRVR